MDRNQRRALQLNRGLITSFRIRLHNCSSIDVPAGSTVFDVAVPPPADKTAASVSRSVIQLQRTPE